MGALLVAGSLAGCSSDYLDVAPVTEVATSEISKTLEGAEAALTGLCQSMYMRYSSLFDYLFMNGEPYVSTVYGDIMGQDYFSMTWAAATGNNFKWVANEMPNGWLAGIPWSYCYTLINQANVILAGIDTVDAPQADKDFIKAQALTIRCHAYIRLLQVYAPRWEDSNNGEKYCVVLRLEPGVNDVPLFTMNKVFEQIYGDLDTAEALFTSCGKKRTYNWQPDINVAKGLYARAAMLKHDYPTAEQKARESREGYPIMSADEYKAGFCKPNGEWIWSVYNGGETLYTTFGNMFACNGVYPGVWGREGKTNAGAINYELYRLIPKNDIRRDLFFTPDKIADKEIVKTSYFWNKNYINTETMDLNELNNLMKGQITYYQDHHYPTYTPNESERYKKSDNGWMAPYTNFENNSNSNCMVVFGAQYKFWSFGLYNAGCYVVLRGADMLLIEAEAAYHNSHPSVAIANLKELNAERNPDYNCTLSGEALLDEIKTQRRIELWGEGHNFFDLKRWNMPMIRNPWKEGDTKSNNIPVIYELTKQPGDRGWKYAVPMSESRYNKAVDRTLVDD